MTRAWIASLLLFAMSCGGSGGTDAGQDNPALAARRRAVVLHTAELVAADVAAFQTAAAALDLAVQQYAAALTPETLEDARAAWIAAIAIWQRIEAISFGPAAMTPFSGALAIRDEIYSFPIITTCRIDQETVAESYEDREAFANELVNVRGLGAMEYLLFATSVENTCPPASPINIDGSWAALGEEEVIARRASYAATLSALVAEQAARLVEGWGDEDSGFMRELATAGDGSTVFVSAQAVLNEIAGALLYVDKIVKEMKLGEPAGIIGCTTGAACLVELESRLSSQSKEHLLANLQAFRDVVIGEGDAAGFDDMLRDAGQAELADDLTTQIDDTIGAIEGLDGSLEQAITDDPSGVMAAFDTLATMLRLFKVDVFTALDIEVRVVPTDND
jgi:predicted lipoprotein